MSSLPARPLGHSPNGRGHHLVALASVEDDGLGEELQVLWELEPGARVHERAALPEPTGFDEPRRLDAFLDAIRWKGVHTGALQTPTGTIPPSNKRIEVPACQVIKVEGGKVKSFTHYFDMVTLLTQIGAFKG